MGAGLALEFKKRYPEFFAAYRQLHADGQLAIDRLFFFIVSVACTLVIFPTKTHWRHGSRLSAVEGNLRQLRVELESGGIRSVAIPAVGCGLGGLKWGDVLAACEAIFGDMPGCEVSLYEPRGR